MSEFWKLVLTALGAIGTTTGLLLFLLKQYGKSWIENRFAQRLAHFTHQQDVELHKLRIEIDSILSGALKIQEKEFETLPKAWRKLDEAFVQLNNLVSPIIRKVDLDNKSELQLEEFLEDSE